MLAKSSYDKAALFPTPSILQEPIDNALFHLATTLTLAAGYLNERLIYSSNCQRSWLSERIALLFLSFKRNITSISMLVIYSFKSAAIEPANLF
jgi:hypothetical protein